jgi:predicted dehydrogenase
MRIAIIGAGLQGNRRAQALVGLPGTELVIVTAKEHSSAAPLAARMQCAAGAGWEDVVRRKDIDVVLVCTPPDIHAAITLAALNEGKHVLCEKPLARTIAEAEAMVATAREKGLVLKCGFNHRHHPGVVAAKKQFDCGVIGVPIFLRAVYGICGRPGYEKEWRADPSITSGGQLMEQGIHVIDLFRWFLGEIQDVIAVAETSYWPIAPLEDNAFVTCRTATGVPASLHSSLTLWKNIFSFEVHGKEGYLAVEGLGGGYGTEKLITGRTVFDRPFVYETTEFRGGDISWKDEWLAFLDATNTGAEVLGSGTDGVEALRIVFAAYEAARLGRRITLASSNSRLSTAHV